MSLTILSVDPGYDRLGIAVIEKDSSGKEKLLFSTCIRTSKKLSFQERLFEAVQAFEHIIDMYTPSECSIEKLFFKNNQKTGMFVSQVIGAITYAAMERGIAVFEYTPLEIKAAVTGSGRSDKKDIMRMIPLLISCPKILKGEKMLDDEFDAIAVGLTHSVMRIGRITAKL